MLEEACTLQGSSMATLGGSRRSLRMMMSVLYEMWLCWLDWGQMRSYTCRKVAAAAAVSPMVSWM